MASSLCAALPQIVATQIIRSCDREPVAFRRAQAASARRHVRVPPGPCHPASNTLTQISHAPNISCRRCGKSGTTATHNPSTLHLPGLLVSNSHLIDESSETMTKRPLYVGIDLGTTNSTAAVFDGEEVTLIRNSAGSVLTPSVVRIDARGNVTVGARARRFLDTDPANTRSEFKRLMGTTHRLEFPASGAFRQPEELSAEVLKSLRQDVADQLGVAPERAVVSVPALFELHQTAAASNAALRAGFERVELIQEPVASAIAAGWTQGGSNGPWLVYDLGGGTFDVSLLETREGLLRVVGHDGDNFLGGRDFDRALTDLALAKLAADGIVIDRANPRHARALRHLRLAAEEAKIELTRAAEAPITIAGLDGDGRPRPRCARTRGPGRGPDGHAAVAGARPRRARRGLRRRSRSDDARSPG